MTNVRMINQLKMCRMRLPYRQRQQERASRWRRDPKLAMCAQQSQRCGSDPAAGGDDCNHTRLALLDDYPDKFDRQERDLSEEILTNAVCSRTY